MASANGTNTREGIPSRLLLSLRGRSIAYMSLSLAIHLGGYELSRASVMALFTSDKLGFGRSEESGGAGGGGGLSALPMAVGCVSPFSIGLLWFYGKTLDRGGPSYALRTHTWICAMLQIISGWALTSLDNYMSLTASSTLSTTNAASAAAEIAPKIFVDANLFSQTILFLLFVFQNAYVQLLYNQHWAFISSVLTPEEGSKVFAPIAGLGSIGSTVAAGLVSIFVGRIGLIGLLHLAGVSYFVSAIFADMAFALARRGGFEPKGGKAVGIRPGDSNNRGSTRAPETTPSAIKGTEAESECFSSYKKENNIFQQAYSLFQRVPVLGALFFEVIVSQCLSSLVNFIYLFTLKSTIVDDALRAGWSGKFYA